MPLEQQVSSRESSQRLRELGVKQESFFVWIENNEGREPVIRTGEYHGYYGRLSAFTVAELGEILKKGTRIALMPVWNGEMWESVGSDFLHYFEAEARAKMLIYLLENKLITL